MWRQSSLVCPLLRYASASLKRYVGLDTLKLHVGPATLKLYVGLETSKLCMGLEGVHVPVHLMISNLGPVALIAVLRSRVAKAVFLCECSLCACSRGSAA